MTVSTYNDILHKAGERYGERTLSDVLAGLGIRHERDSATDGSGGRVLYDSAGNRLGRFDAFEAWEWLCLQPQ